MAKHPWLTRRGSVYYLRAPVPKDIRASVGKAEITRSLRTGDRAEANRLIHAEALAVVEVFEAHRQRCVVPTSVSSALTQPAPLAPLTLQSICDQHYRSIRDQDFIWRAKELEKMRADPRGFFEQKKYFKHPTKERWSLTALTDVEQTSIKHSRKHFEIAFSSEFTAERALIEWLRRENVRRAEALDEALLIGDCSKMEVVADEVVRSQALLISEADRRLLIRRLMEAEVRALRDILADSPRRYEETVSQHSPAALQSPAIPGTAPSGSAEPGPLLASLVPKFLAEGKSSGSALTTSQSDETDLRESVDVVGNRPIRTYTKADGVKFKNVLIATPKSRDTSGITSQRYQLSMRLRQQRAPTWLC